MLKAIDVQQVVMQMEQVEKVQRAEQLHPEMQQHYLDMQAKEEHKLRQEKVPDAEEARKTLIREKREQEREKARKRAEEREKLAAADHEETGPQTAPGEEDREDALHGGHINIKV